MGSSFVDDVLNRTETAMTQAHCFLATELALQAQKQAQRVTIVSRRHPEDVHANTTECHAEEHAVSFRGCVPWRSGFRCVELQIASLRSG